ncbi:MAG: hypothetical protein FWG98_14270 [Candidatus Cloacimonetes bacterium]|nr:hypothetical protein [Candidatus Cloacimonadota bacterium]
MEPKLEISPDFTLGDIRKIRDYNYEMTKNMNAEEKRAYYKKEADSGIKEFEKFKAKKRATVLP